ncbi:MAG: UDP-3-O-acyl-N-acetylglucosamine deacetylase [Thermoguttaceae bacterium]
MYHFVTPELLLPTVGGPETPGVQEQLGEAAFAQSSLVPSPHFPLMKFRKADFEQHVRDLLDSLRLQQTLAQTVSLEGFGFWTGEDIRVEFHPAPPHTGYVFVRTDLPGCPRIPVATQYRDDKPRQTSLVHGSARVDMIEHILAALSALCIDNCEIWVNRPEMPGMDGSAAPFVQVLEEGGVREQAGIRPIRVVVEPFQIGNEKGYIEVTPVHGVGTEFRYFLNYEIECAIGQQEYEFRLSPENFRNEVKDCRTFLAKKEADQLISMGLCRRVTTQNVLVFDEKGPIDNTLHFTNECARHKVLDMVGDFALAPVTWIGRFGGHCSGHKMNAECVEQLYAHTVLLDETSLSPADHRLEQIRKIGNGE